MKSLKAWCLLKGKSLIYFSISLCIICSAFVILLLPLPQWLQFLAGIPLFLLSWRFFILANRISGSIFHNVQFPDSNQNSEKTIYVNSGTYNESMNAQGDYVDGDKIEGDYVYGHKYVNTFTSLNFNQGASEAIREVRDTLEKILTNYKDFNFAQQRIIDDLICRGDKV
jgi:hypothetical protein